jgi:hypothetical protein
VGFLATIISFTRAVVQGAHAPEAKVSRGGNDTLTAGHFSAPGDDSYPLPDDVAYVGDGAGKGAAEILGYQDSKTTPVAVAGEKRIYSRSGPGVVAASVYLRSNGTIIVRNSLGSVELTPTGSVTIGNAVGSISLSALGLVTFTVGVSTVGASTHVHNIPTGVSGPPVPGT